VLPFITASLDHVLTPDSGLTFVVSQYVELAIVIWTLVELGCVRGDHRRQSVRQRHAGGAARRPPLTPPGAGR